MIEISDILTRGIGATHSPDRLLFDLAMNIQELYVTAFSSLLVLLLSWQIAKVGDAFWRRSMQFTRKNILQTLIVTRKAGSSDYTVGVGLAITLLLIGNIVAICLDVKSLYDMT
jgi:hypothetical protein